MLMEINNVIEDAMARTKSPDHPGSLDYRGFAVCAILLCALDAISSYGYGRGAGRQIPPFIEAHFPQEYRPFADDVRELFRNASVHSWNLFSAEILPGNDGICSREGRISFGLLNFFDALKSATEDFLKKLARSPKLQSMARHRYQWLLDRRRGLKGV